jgi:hypothetical protein
MKILAECQKILTQSVISLVREISKPFTFKVLRRFIFKRRDGGMPS